jgi:hypothetical protein
MTGTRVPPEAKTGVRRRRLDCRECGRVDPMMRAGLCRACERAKRESAGKLEVAERASAPVPPPEDLYASEEPPDDLFEE